jgi:hypothetical protein
MKLLCSTFVLQNDSKTGGIVASLHTSMEDQEIESSEK